MPTGMEKILEGDLARFRLADLLHFVSQSGLTAVLVLERPDQETKLFFREGRPVFAVSTHDDLRLGRLLVRLGKVKASDVEGAVLKRRAGGWRLGQVFVSDKVLTEDELAAALKVQVSEVIFDAFGWRAGSFALFDKVPPPVTAVTLDADLQTLVMEGVRRQPAGEARDLAQSLDQVLEALVNPERVKYKVALTREEWRVFFLADGRRTLRDVCRLSGLPDERATLQVVQRLLDGRLVGLAGIALPATVPAPIEAEPEFTYLAPQEAPPAQVDVQFATGARARAPQDDTNKVVRPEAVKYLADAQKLTISRLVLQSDGAERSFPLIRDTCTLGRHRNNDVVIADPKVSSFHARIDRTAEGFVLVDLGSRNGSFVNGKRVTGGPLQTGDEVRLGTARLLYKVDYTSSM
jgi:hypothetical protein